MILVENTGSYVKSNYFFSLKMYVMSAITISDQHFTANKVACISPWCQF